MYKSAIKVFICLLGVFSTAGSFAQQDTLSFFTSSPVYNATRVKGVAISGVLSYSTVMLGIYHLWYKGFPLERFHGFNDDSEWLQMDKVGHVTTAYYVGLQGLDVMRWTGMERKKGILIGGMTGLVFLTSIEILDGFSPKWGFSNGDMIANVAGTGMVISQGLAWDEQRVKLKFSFHQSNYSQYRPGLLGSNLAENIMKDYNGQTYWLSANIHSFLHKKSRFPKWLNIAVGYGAEGMISGKENPADSNDPTIPYIKRYRQYYLSLDIDASKIKTRSKLLHAVLTGFTWIKIPAPTLEFNQGGKIKFYPVYF